MTNITALIERLRAAFSGGPVVKVRLDLSAKDAANLLKILEFVEAMKIETMK